MASLTLQTIALTFWRGKPCCIAKLVPKLRQLQILLNQGTAWFALVNLFPFYFWRGLQFMYQSPIVCFEVRAVRMLFLYIQSHSELLFVIDPYWSIFACISRPSADWMCTRINQSRRGTPRYMVKLTKFRQSWFLDKADDGMKYTITKALLGTDDSGNTNEDSLGRTCCWTVLWKLGCP